ncbi:unnamed protein product [Ambrosiozyma monospora]|uniref:Unnamed protein product n=1 Tax=Ambrosiozyma monospora TaxID=43982 RepID=A0A9W6T283_AMBMO|nr:unnamed protein product [Ambrosiozyma monospora]
MTMETLPGDLYLSDLSGIRITLEKLVVGQYDQFGDLITSEYLEQFNPNPNTNPNTNPNPKQPQDQGQDRDQEEEEDDVSEKTEQEQEQEQPAALRIVKLNGLKIPKNVMIWVNLQSPRFNDSRNGGSGVMLSSNGHVLLSGVVTENLKVWIG